MEKISFNELTSTFKSSIKTWDYFVDWEKVSSNVSSLEIALNKLNYLLGKDDLRLEFDRLFQDNRDIVRAIPILLATRESTVEVFDTISNEAVSFDFKKGTNTVEEYFSFLQKSGLLDLFKQSGIKNLVDYVTGVEVGLDSNGRKNRGGTLMEEVVERYIRDFVERNGYEYIRQATATEIMKKWGKNVQVDKSERSFDFAMYNPTSKRLKLVEVNFYNGGGSKLKAVCGEFKGLYEELANQDIDFIWITDGLGWKTTLRPLEEAFNHIQNVFNLKMLEEGVLSNLRW